MSYETGGKKPISVGPWGGYGGSQFDDGVYTGIRQLVVVHEAAIKSIQIKYDKKGSSVWSDKHGEDGGTKIEKIKLDFPDEVLTSICGYYGSISNGSPDIVRSLTFESNQAKYGPYGLQQGTNFSFPITSGKIVGFHGRCGCYLDSIGVHLKPLQKPDLSSLLLPSQIGYDVIGENADNSKVSWNNGSRQSSDTIQPTSVETKSMVPSYTVTDGPWGGSSGFMFDDGVYTGVREVNLSRDYSGIFNMEVVYDRFGHTIQRIKHGGPNYLLTKDKIILDYPHEVLTRISGYYGPLLVFGPTIIKSMTFHTTKKKYGPFGYEQGIFFSSKIKEGMIVGFYGRIGTHLNSIGVHILEKKVDNGVVKELVPNRPGQWGGDGVRPWDDSIFSGVKHVFVTSGQSNINLHYKGASDFFDTNVNMTGTGNLYSLPSTQPAQRGHT